MNQQNHHHKTHGDPNGGPGELQKHPYWKRAHRDWRFYAAVFLMLAAMAVYVLTEDLAWAPHLKSQPDNSYKVLK